MTQQTTAQLRLLRTQLDDLANRVRNLEDVVSDESESDEPTPEVMFNSVEEFVDRFVRTRYEIAAIPGVQGTDQHWCDQWQQHPMAELLMRVWWHHFEESRIADGINGGGAALDNYLINFFYPGMDRLTGPTGPFKLCHTEGTSHPPQPLGAKA